MSNMNINLFTPEEIISYVLSGLRLETDRCNNTVEVQLWHYNTFISQIDVDVEDKSNG